MLQMIRTKGRAPSMPEDRYCSGALMANSIYSLGHVQRCTSLPHTSKNWGLAART